MSEQPRRPYSDTCASTIAGEVVATGRSAGWTAGDADETPLAAAAEARLAHFNIGCVDVERGGWAYVVRGTKLLRDRLRDAASMLRWYTVRFPSQADAAIFAEVWSVVFKETPTAEGATVRLAVTIRGPSREEIESIAAGRGGILIAWPGGKS